jgi:hypothetical protein
MLRLTKHVRSSFSRDGSGVPCRWPCRERRIRRHRYTAQAPAAPSARPTKTRAESQKPRLYFVPRHTPNRANPRRSMTLPLSLKREQGWLKALIHRRRCAPPASRSLLPGGLPAHHPPPLGPPFPAIPPVRASLAAPGGRCPHRLGTRVSLMGFVHWRPHRLTACQNEPIL